jgi:hypothetical protein
MIERGAQIRDHLVLLSVSFAERENANFSINKVATNEMAPTWYHKRLVAYKEYHNCKGILT